MRKTNGKPVPVTQTLPDRPQTTQESSQAIDIQCVRVKYELSRLKALLALHPHEAHRVRGEALFETAHNAFDAIQSYITSR